MSSDIEYSRGFPRIILSQRETYHGTSYQRNNISEGKFSGALVIQHTESGAAWLQAGADRHSVPIGKAMLFVHGEDASYGCATPPYQLKFVTMSCTRGTYDLFNHIRGDFGSVVEMEQGGQADLLMNSIVETSSEQDDPLWVAEECFRLLIAIYREQITKRQGDDPIAYGRFLLESQYRSPHNLKEWAEQIGITREHFTREFRKRYGETPAAFLRRQRLNHARILMKTSPYSMEKIAMLSGFANVQALRRLSR